MYNYLINYNSLKDISEPIGSIGVARIHDNTDAAEIGYCIGKNWWGNGIMTEAFSAVIPYLFNVGFKQILSQIAVIQKHYNAFGGFLQDLCSSFSIA